MQRRKIQINIISTIYLKIKGPGEIKLFSELFTKLPNEIYINEVNQATRKKEYTFEKSENNVTIIWNDKLDTLPNILEGCSNITEIDFSLF